MAFLIRLPRRSLGLLLVALIVALGSLVGLLQVAHVVNRDVFVVRGQSMVPTLALGSLIVAEPVAPDAIALGDVISVRAGNGVVFTHRVVGVTQRDGAPVFQTKGDANTTADPTPVVGSAVIGRVTFSVPYLGFIVAMLGTLTGVESIASLLGSLLLAFWLFQDLEEDLLTPSPATEKGRREVALPA